MGGILTLSHLSLFFKIFVQVAIGMEGMRWISQAFKPNAQQRFFGNNSLPNRNAMRIVCFAPVKC